MKAPVAPLSTIAKVVNEVPLKKSLMEISMCVAELEYIDEEIEANGIGRAPLLRLSAWGDLAEPDHFPKGWRNRRQVA